MNARTLQLHRVLIRAAKTALYAWENWVKEQQQAHNTETKNEETTTCS